MRLRIRPTGLNPARGGATTCERTSRHRSAEAADYFGAARRVTKRLPQHFPHMGREERVGCNHDLVRLALHRLLDAGVVAVRARRRRYRVDHTSWSDRGRATSPWARLDCRNLRQRGGLVRVLRSTLLANLHYQLLVDLAFGFLDRLDEPSATVDGDEMVGETIVGALRLQVVGCDSCGQTIGLLVVALSGLCLHGKRVERARISVQHASFLPHYTACDIFLHYFSKGMSCVKTRPPRHSWPRCCTPGSAVSIRGTCTTSIFLALPTTQRDAHETKTIAHTHFTRESLCSRLSACLCLWPPRGVLGPRRSPTRAARAARAAPPLSRGR